MRKGIGQRVRLQFEEVPPTKYAVVCLVEAGPVPNWRAQIGRHVPLSFRQWHLEEPFTHIHHVARDLFWNAVIHYLRRYICLILSDHDHH